MAQKLSDKQFQAIARAVSEPRRYSILQRIASGECLSCADLRGAFPISAATLSHHLKELEQSGLIETERHGKFMHPTFCRPVWDAYLARLRDL